MFFREQRMILESTGRPSGFTGLSPTGTIMPPSPITESRVQTPIRLPFHLLDVFSANAYGGNGLAVVLDADGLDGAQMQRMAAAFKQSETVFVLSATQENALLRLRIFTPARELPFAGHPTVGAACLLAELGIAPAGDDVRFTLEEGVGLIPVRVRRAPDRPNWAEFATVQLPEFGPLPPPPEALAATLGLSPDAMGLDAESPRNVSCGLPFLLVPVRTPEQLAAVDIDHTQWRNHLRGGWAEALYVYTRGYEGELRARMFAPGLGMAEDPATGAAAAALAGALATDSPIVQGRLQWTIQQGHEMGRPSELHIAAERAGGVVTEVRVGGHAVRIAEGWVQTP